MTVLEVSSSGPDCQSGYRSDYLSRYDTPGWEDSGSGKSKVVFNPLRLGTVIVLVSSGIDFVNTPRLYSDRATR